MEKKLGKFEGVYGLKHDYQEYMGKVWEKRMWFVIGLAAFGGTICYTALALAST